MALYPSHYISLYPAVFVSKILPSDKFISVLVLFTAYQYNVSFRTADVFPVLFTVVSLVPRRVTDT